MCTFINQMFTGEGDLRGNFVTYQYNAPHIHSASEKGRGCLVSTVINYYTTLRCSVLPTLQNMNWKEYPFVYYSSHSSPHTHTHILPNWLQLISFKILQVSKWNARVCNNYGFHRIRFKTNDEKHPFFWMFYALKFDLILFLLVYGNDLKREQEWYESPLHTIVASW